MVTPYNAYRPWETCLFLYASVTSLWVAWHYGLPIGEGNGRIHKQAFLLTDPPQANSTRLQTKMERYILFILHVWLEQGWSVINEASQLV